MLVDLDTDTLPDSSPDIVIVGAGALGLTLGVSCAAQGRRVLVLEAGGIGVTPQSQIFLQNARSVGHPLGGLHQGRFRTLGGTTTFWGGQLVPLDPLTYSHRPWVSDCRWPISHADVAPYYERVFEMLGMSRQISDNAEVWRRVRVNRPIDTDALELIFTRWAPEPDFSRLFEQSIRQLPNLTVAINAPVTALRTSADGRRVTSVLLSGASKPRVVHAPCLVLCAGAIEIARLLLCPLAGGTVAPWSRHAWLGRGFMDHVEAEVGTVQVLDRRRFHARFDNIMLDGIKYQPRIKLSEAAQQRRQLLSSVAYFRYNSALGEHIANMKIFIRGVMRGRLDLSLFRKPGELWSLLKVMAPMVRAYLRDHRIHAIADRGIDLVICSEQRPLLRSAIKLRSEVDALGMPMIDLDWRIDSADLDTLAVFAQLLREHLSTEGLASVTLAPALIERDPAFIGQVHDTYHQMGTARMSADASSGVVDGQLKVHGTDNLYVAGAAVFPTAGFQNCTFTAMALGQRLADRLTANALATAVAIA